MMAAHDAQDDSPLRWKTKHLRNHYANKSSMTMTAPRYKQVEYDVQYSSPLRGKTTNISSPCSTKSFKKMIAPHDTQAEYDEQDVRPDVLALKLANEKLQAKVDELEAANEHLYDVSNNLRTTVLGLTREKQEVLEAHARKLWADLSWAQENHALGEEVEFLHQQLKTLRNEELYRDSSNQQHDGSSTEVNGRKERARRVLGTFQLRVEGLEEERDFYRGQLEKKRDVDWDALLFTLPPTRVLSRHGRRSITDRLDNNDVC